MFLMSESSFLNPGSVIKQVGLDEGMRVADFGAGSGFFTRAAAREVGEHGEVWAVDINRALLPRIKNHSAAEGINTIEVIHGDIAKVGGSNLPESSFDLVVAANILFAIEEKEEVAKEIARVLKKNGRALIVDWQGSFGGLGPHEDHVFSRSDAAELFERMRFSIVKDVKAGAYHWGFIVKKLVNSD